MESFSRQNTQALSFKHKILLLSTAFVGVFFFFSFSQSSVFYPSNKMHKQHSLPAVQFQKVDLFSSLLGSVVSAVSSAVKTVSNALGVAQIASDVKTISQDTTTSQKVAALGTLGGGVALIALIFFFLL